MKSMRNWWANLIFGILLCVFSGLLRSGFSAMGAEAAPFAWHYPVVAPNGDTLLTLTIQPGYYLYRASVAVKLTRQDGQSRELALPPGVTHDDPMMGETEIFPGGQTLEFVIADPDTLHTITVAYQGCGEGSQEQPGICFPPRRATVFETNSPAASPTSSSTSNNMNLSALPDSLAQKLAQFTVVRRHSGTMSVAEMEAFLTPDAAFVAPGKATQESTASADTSSDASFWALFSLIVLGGLSLNLTPCVLPMIPINLAIIGAGTDGGTSRWTGFRRGAFYGLGIALVYGILGVAAALTGSRFGALNSSPWFNGAIAGIFLLLAIALFGGFNLDFSRFAPSGGRRNQTRTIKIPPELSALFMGGVAALLAGACVAPVVISVIVLAARLYSEGVWAGLLLPFALGAAMALPWPLAGAGLAVLPPPGRWMVYVKYTMASVILLAGGYFGYLAWSLHGGEFAVQTELTRLEETLTRAAATQRPVWVDCWASWCKNCRAMEHSVLHQPAVEKALQHYEVVKFQAERFDDPAVKAVLDVWAVPGLPTYLILEPRR